MDDNDRKEFENRVNNHYSHYGKIAVEFERMCHFLRIDILLFLEGHGLKEQDLSRIMMADLSAYQLITKFRAIYAFTYQHKPDYVKYLDPFFKALLKINEQRNFIIHGNWLIPEVNDHNMKKHSEFEKVIAHKEILKKDGIHHESALYGETEYKALISKIKESTRILNLILASYQLKEDIFKIVKSETLKKVL